MSETAEDVRNEIRELGLRLAREAATIDGLADDEINPIVAVRLRGVAEGVRLAMSYMGELLRG